MPVVKREQTTARFSKKNNVGHQLERPPDNAGFCSREKLDMIKRGRQHTFCQCACRCAALLFPANKFQSSVIKINFNSALCRF